MSNVTNRTLHQVQVEDAGYDYGLSFSWTNKVVAATFWLVGWFFTYQVAQVLPLFVWVAAIGSFFLQLGLTFLESPIWNVEKRYQYDDRGRLLVREARRWGIAGAWVEKPDLARISPISWAALIVDGLLNMAGVWILVKILHTLPPVQAIEEMFNVQIPAITGWYALGLCLTLGLLFCGAPERLWHRR
jgi:hypothetical protein